MSDIPRVQSRSWDPPSVQPGKGPSSSCTIRLFPLPRGADLLIPSRKRSLAAVPWIGLRNSVIGKAVKADHSYIAGFLPEKPNGAECSPSRAQSCAINPELALGLVPCLLGRPLRIGQRCSPGYRTAGASNAPIVSTSWFSPPRHIQRGLNSRTVIRVQQTNALSPAWSPPGRVH